MCLIISCKVCHPTLDMLERAQVANPHGAGVAWLRRDHTVEWFKGLKAHEVAEMIAEGTLRFPYIIHFRSASVGEAIPELCHPFPIEPEARTALSGTAPRVLFHNGTCDYAKYAKDTALSGPVSDTRVLAAWLAPRPIFTDTLFESFPNSRFALLDCVGPILYGRWWRLDGVDLSNTDF